MNRHAIQVNRWLVGGLCLLSLAGSALTAIYYPAEEFWWAGMLRGGVFLGALWLCLPTTKRPAAWADLSPMGLTLAIVLVILTLIRPRVGLPILLVVLAIRAVLPKRRRR